MLRTKLEALNAYIRKEVFNQWSRFSPYNVRKIRHNLRKYFNSAIVNIP